MNWKDINTGYICPICGLNLDFIPWDKGADSQEICPCCGNQFGYTDAAPTPDGVIKRWRERRSEWIASGMKWGWSIQDNKTIEELTGEPDDRKPQNWNPNEQLKNIPEEYR